MTRITVVVGDITTQEVDAVVNAANRSLLGGGGVDGAIHRRGGPRILEECRQIRQDRYPDGLPVGQAVATGGGNLPAAHVIHVVGPVYGRGLMLRSPVELRDADAPELLASCHREALRLADELGARSIAFPAISTGAYGYPVEEAAPVAIGAVLAAETRLEEVRFVLFSPGAHAAFRTALSEAQRAAGPG
jgi:O-acetyl-ADP-ribose deacetylase (regulator of RNase III)